MHYDPNQLAAPRAQTGRGSVPVWFRFGPSTNPFYSRLFRIRHVKIISFAFTNSLIVPIYFFRNYINGK